MLKDLYQQVTDKILQQLEKGVVPWVKPWKSKGGATGLPINKVTGKNYQGVNIPLLWGATEEHGFTTNEFATFNQWADNKEIVKKGEKGTMIVYFDTMLKPDKNNEDELKVIPFIKSSYVFNRCQLKSYVPEEPPAEKPLANRIEAVEMFVKNVGAQIEYGGDVACYNPMTDKIKMPHAESFVDQNDCTAIEAFYSTQFHELTHYTGHVSRLDRGLTGKFGSEKYAKEELVAELGASFLCAELQIEREPVENHAAYIEGWSRKLKAEPKTFITAASQASKAVSYLHGERLH